MTILRKLWLAYGAALGLIVGAAAIAQYVSLDYERSIGSLDREYVQGSVALTEAMDAFWKLHYGLHQYMVLGTEDRPKIVAEDAMLYGQIESRLRDYEVTRRAPTEKQALRDLRISLNRYILARPVWFELYGGGKLEEAAAWRARYTTPLGAATIAAFEKQIHLQHEEAGRVVAAAYQAARNSRLVMYAMVTMMALVATATFTLALRMLRPLKRLRKQTDRAARQFFGATVEVETGDEVESLARTWARMKDSFIAHNADLINTREKLAREGLVLGQTVQELEQVIAQKEAQAAESGLFYELGEYLQSCSTLVEANAVIQRIGPRLFPNHAGAIYLLQPSRDLLEPVMCWDSQDLILPFTPDDCWALRRGKTHRVDDADHALVCAHHVSAAFPYLCVPLNAHGETIGLLHLRSSSGAPAETDNAERRSAGAANQIGLVMGNLRLRESLRTQSLRDALTGLYNRRFLDESLQRETARAQRTQLPLSVLMLDLDHFKRFNDTFGHEGGDETLRAVSRLIRDHFRESDLCCRYGGEEFTVVMPDAPLDMALRRAETLREAVEKLDLTLAGKQLGSITLSIGVATMPQHGTTPLALLQQADAALYQAKESGRNRVVASGPPVTEPDTGEGVG